MISIAKSGITIFRVCICVYMLLLIAGCSPSIQVKRGFYYWKSNQSTLSDEELQYIKMCKTQKLYVKFFEVALDDVLGPFPIAKSELHTYNYNYAIEDSELTNSLNHLAVVPVVYIKNEVFKDITKGSIDSLADNIIVLIKKYYASNYKHTVNDFAEIQLDCDWTESTKGNYFYFLEAIKKQSQKLITCTLRLYPYKYAAKMGVPPVDRATLMCYNLISPFAQEDKNSILDTDELEKYLINTDEYKLPLDIALPVFEWMQVFQNQQFKGLVTTAEINADSLLKPIKPLWYQVKYDYPLDRLFLRSGDLIKYEKVSNETLTKTISMLKKYIHFSGNTTLIFFQLDASNLKSHPYETLDHLYTDFAH